MADIKAQVIKLSRRHPTPKAATIAKEIGVEVRVVRKILKKLTVTERTFLQSKSSRLFTGKINVCNHATAFFISDNKNMKDVFIHKNNLKGAGHGDKVDVKFVMFKGRQEAIVESIIERGIAKIIGVASIGQDGCRVTPFSKNFTHDVVIEKYDDIKDGDVVVCVIEKYPEKKFCAMGRVEERVCHITDNDADNLVVLYKYGLSRCFPKSVESDVKKIEKGEVETINIALEDYSNQFCVTIDGETAKDFDDAVSVEETENGFILYVHIADVSRFVTISSPIDEEAKMRGTSVYFPQFAVPMLPEILSNDKCSLLPNVDRFTVTAKIFYDKSGVPLKSLFSRSVIKSRHRLTYDFVNRALSGTETNVPDDLLSFLKKCEKLAHLIMGQRQEAGYIDFNNNEAYFNFNEKGEVIGIAPYVRGFAERMIEFFMLAANEAAAAFLENHSLSGIYRIHETPDRRKLKNYLKTARKFGLMPPALKQTITNGYLAKLAQEAASSKYSDILSNMLIRCMMKAEYSVENKGHFGLNAKAYTHFTSPIRRYPDLLVHRAILNKLGQGQPSESISELEKLAPELSSLEQMAEDAEYEISMFKKIEYLQNNPDEIYSAYINKISSNGLFVYLEKLLTTAFIDFVSIDYDTFYVNEFLATGRGTGDKYKIGDKINVLFDYANIFLLQINMKLEKNGKQNRRN